MVSGASGSRRPSSPPPALPAQSRCRHRSTPPSNSTPSWPSMRRGPPIAPSPAATRSDRCMACRSRTRTPTTGPPGSRAAARGFVATSFPTGRQPPCGGSMPPERSTSAGSIRRTPASIRSASTFSPGALATLGNRITSPAAHRAALRPRSRPGWSSEASARIRVARSGCRPRFAASSASSRPSAGSAATASCRSASPSIHPARSRERSPIARACSP